MGFQICGFSLGRVVVLIMHSIIYDIIQFDFFCRFNICTSKGKSPPEKRVFFMLTDNIVVVLILWLEWLSITIYCYIDIKLTFLDPLHARSNQHLIWWIFKSNTKYWLENIGNLQIVPIHTNFNITKVSSLLSQKQNIYFKQYLQMVPIHTNSSSTKVQKYYQYQVKTLM